MGHETVLYLDSPLAIQPTEQADQDGNTQPARLTALMKGPKRYRAGALYFLISMVSQAFIDTLHL
jgi:hypothetical protein